MRQICSFFQAISLAPLVHQGQLHSPLQGTGSKKLAVCDNHGATGLLGGAEWGGGGEKNGLEAFMAMECVKTGWAFCEPG